MQTGVWTDYAARRDDRVRSRLQNVLRPAAYARREGTPERGWTLEQDRVIVWEPLVFKRTAFNWDDVPSTLIHSDASGGGRTVLVRSSVEEFLNTRLRRPFRLPWHR